MSTADEANIFIHLGNRGDRGRQQEARLQPGYFERLFSLAHGRRAIFFRE